MLKPGQIKYFYLLANCKWVSIANKHYDKIDDGYLCDEAEENIDYIEALLSVVKKGLDDRCCCGEVVGATGIYTVQGEFLSSEFSQYTLYIGDMEIVFLGETYPDQSPLLPIIAKYINDNTDLTATATNGTLTVTGSPDDNGLVIGMHVFDGKDAAIYNFMELLGGVNKPCPPVESCISDKDLMGVMQNISRKIDLCVDFSKLCEMDVCC
jgi:hypothetical protein